MGGRGHKGAPFHKSIEYCLSLPAILSLSRKHKTTLAGSMWLGLRYTRSTILSMT